MARAGCGGAFMGYIETFPFGDGPFDQTGCEDRRSGERYVSVLKICRAIIGDHDQLCMVRNISSKGMKIELPGHAAPGDRVTIELRSDRILHGTIRWWQTHACGIELDDQVNLDEMLDNKPPSSLLRCRPRSPRFVRSAALSIEHSGGKNEGMVYDISLQGICAEIPFSGRIGDRVVATVEGLPARSALVRWIRDKRLGLHFERSWPFTELALWLDSYNGK